MVNLTKSTGRHASTNVLRSTDPAAQNYRPRHGRGDYVVSALRSGRFIHLNV